MYSDFVQCYKTNNCNNYSYNYYNNDKNENYNTQIIKAQ